MKIKLLGNSLLFLSIFLLLLVSGCAPDATQELSGKISTGPTGKEVLPYFELMGAGLYSPLKIYDADGSNYIAIDAPSVVSTNYTWIWPSSDGSSNQVLKTDGAGNLSFGDPGATYTAGIHLGLTGSEFNVVFDDRYVHIGSGGTTNYVDGSGDLYVADELEVDGNAHVEGQYIPGTQDLTYSDGTNLVWNVNSGPVAYATLTNTTHIAALTNAQKGATYTLFLTQDGTGGRAVTWDSSFLWPGGLAPTITTNQNSRDTISMICYESNSVHCVWQGDFQ